MAQRTAPQRKWISPRTIERGALVLVLLALLVLAGGLLVGVVRMAWQEHQINRSIERQQAQNAQQAERNLQLQGAADFAESDVAAELAARERLGMARDGEMVLLPTVVLPIAPTGVPSEAPASVAENTPPEIVAQTNPSRWFQAFSPGPEALP